MPGRAGPLGASTTRAERLAGFQHRRERRGLAPQRDALHQFRLQQKHSPQEVRTDWKEERREQSRWQLAGLEAPEDDRVSKGRRNETTPRRWQGQMKSLAPVGPEPDHLANPAPLPVPSRRW